MRSKKILVIFMAVLLLAATFISAMAVGADGSGNTRAKTKSAADDENLPEVPKVTVAGVDVLGAPEFFELSLRVSAKAFQSVGVVLSYNTGVLTPVEWYVNEEYSDEPAVSGNPEAPEPPADTEDGTENTGGTGGETQAPETPSGQPREVAVGGSGWNDPTVLPTKGADGLAGKPALAYAARNEEGTHTGRAYLYLGADALQYTALRQEQVVTVRFRKSSQDANVTLPVDDPNVTSENFTVCLATPEIAADSIPGAQLLSTAGKGMDGEPLVYTYGDLIQEDDAETPYGLTFTKTQEPSIYSGNSSGGGDYAITFFDWDGRVIDAIAADKNAEEELAALMERQAGRLSNKPGYAFDTWLVATQTAKDAELQRKNGVFTSNNTKLDTSKPEIKAAVADFSDLEQYKDPETGSKSLLVQAAYVAKTTDNKFTEDLVNNGSTVTTDMYYTISEPNYTRYGSADANTGSYSLTMTVTRKQQTWGVTRLREPGIWVAMEPVGGGSRIMSLIRLENTDETTFEIVTNKQIDKVTYMVIDTYGVSNWTGAQAQSDPNASKDLGTCIRNGTRGYLAKQARLVASSPAPKPSWEATADAQAFADCFYGLSGQANNLRKVTSFWTEGRINTAKAALEAASGSGELTCDQVYNILVGVS